MPSKRFLLSIACTTSLVAGCATGSGAKAAHVSPVTPPITSAPVAESQTLQDPIAILIASSDGHFTAGQAELALGHMEKARAEFDAALDALLESRDGGRTDARLREHFDRLVD